MDEFFGKKYSDFKLYKGDFLSQEEFVTVELNSSKRKVSMGDYVKEIINESK